MIPQLRNYAVPIVIDIDSPTRIRLLARLGHQFSDASLLDLALSHRSCGKHNNERLEFLGDSLLGYVIGEELYERFPEATEGELSRLRSVLVKGETLAVMAREFDLGPSLKLGEGEMKSGGFRRDSILADTVEAIIGAILKDADFATAKTCILAWYQDRLNAPDLFNTLKDSKTQLQEMMQARQLDLPEYQIIETKGDAHSQRFVVRCSVPLFNTMTQAEASNRRKAEKLAAAEAIAIIEQKGT